MKRSSMLGLSLLILCRCVFAAEAELRIELPNAEFLLPPVSPPELQKEGLPLLREQMFVSRFLPLVTAGQYEAALSLLRQEYDSLLSLLEAGDPDGRVRQRVSAGALPLGGAAGPRGLVDQTGSAGTDRVSSTMLYLIGHVYLSLEQYLPAETAFRNALVPLPDYLRVHESLGLLYLKTERYAEARVHLARAAELGLHTPSLYGALGYLNQQTHNYWGAVSAYQQALVLEDANQEWKRGLLYSLAETHQYESGLTLVEQMLQEKPDDAVLWLYRSHFSLMADERAEALSSLETAIRLGDDSVANLQVCATLHMERGSIARAVDLLKNGFARGMDFQFVDQGLAWLVEQGEWDYLEDLLASMGKERSSLTEPEQSKLLTREASVSLHNKEAPAARTALEKALELDPSNAEALMSLGALYQDDGDYNRAELLFQRASAYDTYRENALISIAQLAIDQDDYERALELLRDVVARNPARTDLRRNIDSLEDLVLLQNED